MPNTANELVYLSDEQFQELVANGSIVVSGTTVTYNPDNIYVTPQQQPYIMPINGIPTSDLAEDAFASDVEIQAIIDEYGSVPVQSYIFELQAYQLGLETVDDVDRIIDAFTSGHDVLLHVDLSITAGYSGDVYYQLVGYQPGYTLNGVDYPPNFIIAGTNMFFGQPTAVNVRDGKLSLVFFSEN